MANHNPEDIYVTYTIDDDGIHVRCRLCPQFDQVTTHDVSLLEIQHVYEQHVLASFVDYIKSKADAAIVCDGNADDLLDLLLAAGWTLSEPVENTEGKRMRWLTMPAS